MTSTNVNPVEQAVADFKQLDIDDRLVVFGSLFSNVADTISTSDIDKLPTQKAAELVAQIQQLSPEEQLYALRDLLPASRNDQNETMLDPHPSKAMVELAQGGTKIPTGEYGKLNAEGKLAFWYFLGQRLGSTIINIPSNYTPTEQATAVLNNLQSLNTNDLVSFLKQVLQTRVKA
ncbi:MULTISPECIES: orange carotenoid protein N-terminal domain-containing protein [unclassified Anabaena]|uniref:orange carotenoid protein N-terminal domain-containing protein n=1 Tax=unclassified Anabaena TaxID=2619674 RepID=UPI002B1FB37B|nr:orange carotenoid protein N-terminal domain-containing protein [Anabaena sp. UHCC 0399]MEA5565331.1 orange carotenoid protein N-terminal domain-containing protein [Anabaena sp. UHCC 0399]